MEILRAKCSLCFVVNLKSGNESTSLFIALVRSIWAHRPVYLLGTLRPEHVTGFSWDFTGFFRKNVEIL